MLIRLYNQDIITRKKIVVGGIEQVINRLADSLIASYTTSQSMLHCEEYVDVEYNEENLTCNYVIVTDGVESLAYFVNNKKQIANNVLRLFINVDTVSTFFKQNLTFENGYFKRSNAPTIIESAKTLSLDDITTPYEYNVDPTKGLYDNGDEFKFLVNFVYTSGNKAGQHYFLVSDDVVTSFTDTLEEISQIKSVEVQGSTTGIKGDIQINHIYVLPSVFYPNQTGEAASLTLSSGNPPIFFKNVKEYDGLYSGVKPFTITSNFIVEPQYNYKIGGYHGAIDFENPSFKGLLTYSYIVYDNPLNFKAAIDLFGIENDITPTFEVTLLDTTQATQNSQQRANGVISNALTLLGQAGTTAGALMSGNYLAGILGIGQIASNVSQLTTYAQQKISGGVKATINAGELNIAKHLLIGVQVGMPQSGTVNVDISRKGYKMLEKYNANKLVLHYYFEIIADEVEGLPLKYEQDFLTRLSNGVYIN